MTIPSDHEGNSASSVAGKRARRIPITTLILAGLLVAMGIGSTVLVRQKDAELERARGALELQVLASRLGAAAIQAEYGQFAHAKDLMSGVFDGIVNYGIRRGVLPENYANVLQIRDEVVVALAQSRPEVTERLVQSFFQLQLPVHTALDTDYIIPATDSGVGMAPPVRLPAPSPGMPGVSDTASSGTGAGLIGGPGGQRQQILPDTARVRRAPGQPGGAL